MTNTYIQEMKNIATAYYTEVCKLRKTIEYNNTTFTKDLADSYNSETEQKITNQANKSVEEINSVYEEIKSKISIRNFVCPENLGSDSVLKSKILTKPEFDIILKKYLSEYRFVPARQLISEYPTFADDIIPTASDFVETYKKFADSAIRLIYSMRENPRFSKVELDAYADEDFSSGLYSIVGSGQALIPVSITPENEYMSHTFDSVTLGVPSDSEMNFNFKGVR